MERVGRSSNDNDRESRIRNSGIHADMQVYKSTINRPASLAGQPVSSSFTLLDGQNDTGVHDEDEIFEDAEQPKKN